MEPIVTIFEYPFVDWESKKVVKATRNDDFHVNLSRSKIKYKNPFVYDNLKSAPVKKSSKWTCLICNDFFVDKKSLISHYDRHKNHEIVSKDLKIDITDFYSDNFSKIDKKNDFFQCQFCLKPFFNHHLYLKHLKSHENLFENGDFHSENDQRVENGIKTVENCVKRLKNRDKTLEKPSEMEINASDSLKNAFFQCDMCFQAFLEPQKYEKHLKIHENVVKTLENGVETLENTTKNASKSPQMAFFQCEVCFQAFLDAEKYENHLKIHVDLKMPGKFPENAGKTPRNAFFQCENCFQTFLDPQKYANHTKKHENGFLDCENDHKTLENCPDIIENAGKTPENAFFQRETRSRASLNRQNRLINRDNDQETLENCVENARKLFFQCENCFKWFFDEKKYHNHLKIHDKSSFFEENCPENDLVSCDFCFEEFSDLESCEKHLKTHEKDSLVQDFPSEKCRKTKKKGFSRKKSRKNYESDSENYSDDENFSENDEKPLVSRENERRRKIDGNSRKSDGNNSENFSENDEKPLSSRGNRRKIIFPGENSRKIYETYSENDASFRKTRQSSRKINCLSEKLRNEEWMGENEFMVGKIQKMHNTGKMDEEMMENDENSSENDEKHPQTREFDIDYGDTYVKRRRNSGKSAMNCRRSRRIIGEAPEIQDDRLRHVKTRNKYQNIGFKTSLDHESSSESWEKQPETQKNLRIRLRRHKNQQESVDLYGETGSEHENSTKIDSKIDFRPESWEKQQQTQKNLKILLKRHQNHQGLENIWGETPVKEETMPESDEKNGLNPAASRFSHEIQQGTPDKQQETQRTPIILLKKYKKTHNSADIWGEVEVKHEKTSQIDVKLQQTQHETLEEHQETQKTPRYLSKIARNHQEIQDLSKETGGKHAERVEVDLKFSFKGLNNLFAHEIGHETPEKHQEKQRTLKNLSKRPRNQQESDYLWEENDDKHFEPAKIVEKNSFDHEIHQETPENPQETDRFSLKRCKNQQESVEIGMKLLKPAEIDQKTCLNHQIEQETWEKQYETKKIPRLLLKKHKNHQEMRNLWEEIAHKHEEIEKVDEISSFEEANSLLDHEIKEESTGKQQETQKTTRISIKIDEKPSKSQELCAENGDKYVKTAEIDGKHGDKQGKSLKHGIKQEIPEKSGFFTKMVEKKSELWAENADKYMKTAEMDEKYGDKQGIRSLKHGFKQEMPENSRNLTKMDEKESEPQEVWGENYDKYMKTAEMDGKSGDKQGIRSFKHGIKQETPEKLRIFTKMDEKESELQEVWAENGDKYIKTAEMVRKSVDKQGIRSFKHGIKQEMPENSRIFTKMDEKEPKSEELWAENGGKALKPTEIDRNPGDKCGTMAFNDEIKEEIPGKHQESSRISMKISENQPNSQLWAEILETHLTTDQNRSKSHEKTPNPQISPAKPAKYHCEHCDYTTNHNSSLQTHLKRHENRFKYVCEICNKGFFCATWFEEHRNFHSGAKPYVCEVCDKSFAYSRYLNAHKKAMHLEADTHGEVIQCEYCNKRFAHKKSLVLHVRGHLGEGWVLCDVCGKRLSSKDHLKLHRRVHTGYKPYECTTCKKAFSKKCNLTLHERVHTGEKPYVCDVCGKCFSQRSTLVIHARYHSGVRPYVCPGCDKGFVAKGILSIHLKSCRGGSY